MVRNLMAYFILYVIKIKWIMCDQKKLSVLVCHRGQGSEIRVELNQNFRRSLLCCKEKAAKEIAEAFYQG